MNQRLNHIKKGDIVIINRGWSNSWYIAIFIGAKFYSIVNMKDDNKDVISISYIDLYNKRNNVEHIRTRYSTKQRIYKITADNLSHKELDIYYTKLKLL